MEEINKLNQLDRIEYKLDKKEIDRKYLPSNTFSFCYNFSLVIGFIIIASILVTVSSNKTEGILFFSRVIKPIRVLFLIGLIFTVLFDIYEFFMYRNKIMELNKRFFDIVPNKIKEDTVKKLGNKKGRKK